MRLMREVSEMGLRKTIEIGLVIEVRESAVMSEMRLGGMIFEVSEGVDCGSEWE